MSRGRRVAMATLFLITAVFTFANVFGYAIWGIYGRPSHPTESISMVGSLVLIGAAALCIRTPKWAARVALVAALANWSFFSFAAASLLQQESVKQRVEVVFVRWEPGAQPLVQATLPATERAPLRQTSLTDADMTALTAARLAGTVATSGSTTVGEGDAARVVIVMSRQLVSSQIELKQPERTSAIYIQSDAGWRQVPPDAKLNRLTIRLEVANHTRLQTWFSIELPTGARIGGTAYIWPERLATP